MLVIIPTPVLLLLGCVPWASYSPSLRLFSHHKLEIKELLPHRVLKMKEAEQYAAPSTWNIVRTRSYVCIQFGSAQHPYEDEQADRAGPENDASGIGTQTLPFLLSRQTAAGVEDFVLCLFTLSVSSTLLIPIGLYSIGLSAIGSWVYTYSPTL